MSPKSSSPFAPHPLTPSGNEMQSGGWPYFKEAGAKYGLPVISEILYADSLGMMSPYVDMFQIGYRHMFNMDLIEALSKTDKPVMIKRHYGESLRSLLGVAEHFEARGKHDFVFCERGASVPHTHNVESRAVLDIQAIPALKDYAPTVPVIADPSHATSKRSYVAAMSRAAVAAGADGLLIEVHPNPEGAWIDPLQGLNYRDFGQCTPSPSRSSPGTLRRTGKCAANKSCRPVTPAGNS